MGLRVVQWATGPVGRVALRAIIEHPALDLAGVVVYSPEKDGVDAGDLCGMQISRGCSNNSTKEDEQ
jgi:2,4-diaminopentanoate dehydrogenase